MTSELDGKVALVTGGGSGIGLATARTLAEAGCSVAISGRREAMLEDAARELEVTGALVATIVADVSRKSDAERLVAATVEQLGDLHILVNNAGVAAAGPLEGFPEQKVHDVVDIDLKGPIFVSQAALPHLRRHRDAGGASIVNICSSVTLMAVKNYSVYSAAKAGLDMFTRCLALDLAHDRVRVNAISPGVVDTPIFATMMPAAQAVDYVSQFNTIVPLGRHGQPIDIARAVRFLVGIGGDWITGAILPVDGGLSLGLDD